MSFWKDFRKGFGVVWNPIIDAAPAIIKAAGPAVGGAIGTVAGGPGAGTAIGSALGGVGGTALGELSKNIPHFAHGGGVGGGYMTSQMPMPSYYGYPYQQPYEQSYAFGGQVGAGFQNMQQQQAPQQSFGFNAPSAPMGRLSAPRTPQQQALFDSKYDPSRPQPVYASGGNVSGGIGLMDAIRMLPMGGYR